MMRLLHYDRLHPAGHFAMPTEGTVIDLLFDMPYLVGYGYRFPTYEELNGLLAAGEWDTGMGGGCEWSPFTLNPAEYTEVVEQIRHEPRLAALGRPLEGEPWARGLWCGQSFENTP
ncbi:MAG TPA: hypothetical protein VIL85_23960 [Thermomicrobiales bacterium]|jgi:hypothetical protein